MTQILQEKYASFKFIDEFDKIPEEYCQINVKVEKKNIKTENYTIMLIIHINIL